MWNGSPIIFRHIQGSKLSCRIATQSPQCQRGEGLDGGDILTPRRQNIPAIQALPPLVLGGLGGDTLSHKTCNLELDLKHMCVTRA
jgi:hypothetical protein